MNEKNSIVVDRNSACFYAGKIKGVVQWREQRSEARRMGLNRAYCVMVDLQERDDQSIYRPMVIDA